MKYKPFLLGAGVGCSLLLILLIIVIPLSLFTFNNGKPLTFTLDGYLPVTGKSAAGQSQAVPTLTSEPKQGGITVAPAFSTGLVDLFESAHRGVVNISTRIQSPAGVGGGAGSGFLIDGTGHIVTNNHVIEGAEDVTVIFFDGFESHAEVLGADPDSDLAVLLADHIPDDVVPLSIGDSDAVRVGEWVMAIGNPFGLGTSMTIGVISAVERAIASGATPYNIPQAIQTDAAINPGNSGGPLINMAGNVIGVNAQIATESGSSSGVGFSIPANVVRRVVPALIEQGSYSWPYLGVRGTDVNLLLTQAMDLPSQDGAYIHAVTEGGPAAEAGLQGSTGTEDVNGVQVPVGGDIVIAVDNEPVVTFNDLLVSIAYHDVGDIVDLTIRRGEEEIVVPVTLAARPEGVESEAMP